MPTPVGFTTHQEYIDKRNEVSQDTQIQHRVQRLMDELKSVEEVLRTTVMSVLTEFDTVLPKRNDEGVQRFDGNSSSGYTYSYWVNSGGAKIIFALNGEDRYISINFEDPRDPSGQELAQIFG
ncbi:hypothetical protein KBC70_02855 [Candidatus Woesebacteria bacterium]|nr:hypothetical protein [Candidatus Woesebacteria bacterium]